MPFIFGTVDIHHDDRRLKPIDYATASPPPLPRSARCPSILPIRPATPSNRFYMVINEQDAIGPVPIGFGCTAGVPAGTSFSSPTRSAPAARDVSGSSVSPWSPTGRGGDRKLPPNVRMRSLILNSPNF